MNDMKMTDLLSTLCEGLSEEDKTLIGLQAMIAAEISIKRQTLGYSQKQFAEKMHVTQALVSKWESGDTNYTLKTLVQIAEALDIRMQSPYVLPSPAVKYSTKKGNLINFTDYVGAYTTRTSTQYVKSYTVEENILDEM